jgi:glycosyltransferase involved in cell wall biosynthesis
MKNLVSIIVTSYNHAEYLQQRIDSLLTQTYPNIEIIIIDDGSTDASVTVLRKYIKYQNVTIKLLEQNLGYANACNLGVSKSNGEYIMFAECDDYSEHDHVEVLTEKLNDYESAGVAYCKSRIVDRNGNELGDDFQYRERSFQRFCSKDTLIPKEAMKKFLLISCVIPNMSAALIKRKYFDRVLGLSSSYKACADWDFWCRISDECDFFYVASPMNNFRTHPTTVRSTFGISLQVLEIFDILYKTFMKTKLSLMERFKFRINIGFIWSIYITSTPINWLRSFPSILEGSIRYEKWILFFLMLGLTKKGYYIFNRLLRSAGKVSNQRVL